MISADSSPSSTTRRTASMWPRQLPRFVSISRSRSTPSGTALSGIDSPRTPGIHSTSNPVSAAASVSASRLSLRSGRPIAKILLKPRVEFVTRLEGPEEEPW